MRKLDEILNEYQLEKKTSDIQKAQLRKLFIKERENLHSNSKTEDWGSRQFLRALELLDIRLEVINQPILKFHVACYFPIKNELNLSQFAKKHWLFPKTSENKELMWFEYGDGEEGYVLNPYGIKEKPIDKCFYYTDSMLPMICFVPGLLASRDGHRLGYGGGYYDKFIHKFKDKVTSVLCLPSQDFVFDKLPIEDFDEKVDLIVW